MPAYAVYDVFTDTPLTGNPLAIVWDAETLDEGDLPRIAREFNLSETVFVLPPARDGATARLRIFTPTQEVPFAGHPLIGSAVALCDKGAGPQLTLDCGTGPVVALVDAGRAAFTQETPLERLGRPDPALMAACLDLRPETVRTSPRPPVIASVGLPMALVELVDSTALAQARPAIARFREAADRYPLPFDFAIYAYIAHHDWIEARMFAPLDDIWEDPATGSAAAALGAHLADLAGDAVTLTVRQGGMMGRPGVIGVMADTDGVTLSGQAVRVMEGMLRI